MTFQKPTPEEKAEWADRVKQWRDSGQSMASWCREHQLLYHRFLYWKGRFSPDEALGQKVSRADFVQLTENASDTGIAISCAGCIVQLSTEFNEGTLARCLRVLRES